MFGSAAIFISWATSGCRFGSHIENPPDPDQITGYYQAIPQALTFYATTTNTIQQTASVSLVPGEISEVMTNPVALKMDNLATGAARWISPINRVALPVNVSSDLTVSLRGATSPVTLWDDADCKTYLEISESGKLIKTQNVTQVPGSNLPLSGKTQVTFQVVNQLKGDCTGTLKRMADCLDNVTQCGESTAAESLAVQAQILELFNPWLKSGTVAISDIPDLVNFAYEVNYE